MSSDLIQKFMYTLDKQNDKKYLMSTIAYNAAPTLAGEKPSSLVVFRNRQMKSLYTYWEKYKKELMSEVSVDFYELKKDENIISVLFYNKTILKNILNKQKNIKFLKRFGYRDSMSVEESLNLLSLRYEKACPHEIGIFLGYPLDDVVEFTNCSKKQCLMMGYWKVYYDMEKAKDTFERYDNAKIKIVNLLMKDLNPFEVRL